MYRVPRLKPKKRFAREDEDFFYDALGCSSIIAFITIVGTIFLGGLTFYLAFDGLLSKMERPLRVLEDKATYHEYLAFELMIVSTGWMFIIGWIAFYMRKHLPLLNKICWIEFTIMFLILLGAWTIAPPKRLTWEFDYSDQPFRPLN